MRFLTMVLFFMGSPVFAISGGGAAEMLHQTKTPDLNQKEKVEVSVSCKGSSGQVYKMGDRGYDRCLRLAKQKAVSEAQNRQQSRALVGSY